MKLPRVLFVTYTREQPTAQIGVLKRCVRLMSRLGDDVEAHFLNFGPLPMADQQIAHVLRAGRVHPPPDGDLGAGLESLIQRIQPDAVVFGEAPLRGSMRLVHRVASAAGFWQICIENYYGALATNELARRFGRFNRWLLLGLRDSAWMAEAHPGIALCAPLVAPPAGSRPERDRVCCVGYDADTLAAALRFIELLPADLAVDLVVSPTTADLVTAEAVSSLRPTLRVLSLPSDADLVDSICRSHVVFGKAGFQQIVESLSLGAPIVCRYCGGGVDESLVPEDLHPYIRFVRDEADLPGVMETVGQWLRQSPLFPFADPPADALAVAASQLLAHIGQRGDPVKTPTHATNPLPAPQSFEALAALFEAKDWQGLQAQLRKVALSCDGSPVVVTQAAAALRERFHQAADLEILPMGMQPGPAEGAAIYRCCVMWGEADSWMEHDLELDVELTWRDAASGSRQLSELRLRLIDAD